LGTKQVGDKLNVEADILAKHIEKLIEARSQ
jgi:riboflavin synthase alpha subunit